MNLALIIFRRIAARLVTLLVVLVVVFGLQQLVPGDPAIAIAGEQASAELLAQIREQLNLNRPFLAQLGDYISQSLRLDFGNSIQSNQPVTTILREALPVSASLALMALLFTVLIAVPIGTLCAVRPNSWVDRCLVSGTAVTLAVPTFVTGLLLQRLIGVKLGWLPAIGFTALTEDPVQWLRGLLLPAITLATLSASEVARQLRGNLMDTLEKDYIRTLRAKGLSFHQVLFKHGFRNAAAPMLTVLGIQMGQIVGGAVIIESVFALPGLGLVGVNAILIKDYPVVRGVVLFGATMVITVNLLVDLLNVKLNPRAAEA